MHVFLTGGAGYIGSVATKMLIDAGHDVTVFDNLERGHKSALDPRAGFVQGDLRERQEIRAAVIDSGAEAIMHFAAYAYVGESMDDPNLYFRNNVLGTINLTDAMLEADIRKFIFSSTCATYGQPDKVPITEDTPQYPTNPYGESKLMFEKMLSWNQKQKGIRPVFLRYFNACGASGRLGEHHDPEPHLIPLILQVALGQRDKIYIYGDDYDTPDGTCIRDYIHIEDLAEAHMLAMTGDHVGPFNLGNGNGHSVREVVDAAREVTGHPIPAEITPRRDGDPARLVADANKAHTVLGWKPKHPDIKTILQHAWDWHRAYPHGYPD